MDQSNQTQPALADTQQPQSEVDQATPQQPAQPPTPSVDDNAGDQNVQAPVTLTLHYQAIRDQFSNQIKTLQAIVDSRPTEGAEVTLALRHLQDARMRLGVAEALSKGLDPWTTPAQ